jgi:hypothetical protein
LHGAAAIGLAVGAVLDKHKMAKHYELAITDTSFAWRRKEAAIAAEARLDGLYVIRTNVPKAELTAEETVGAYKSLSRVERAFRSLKTVDLEIRPVFHWTAPRVRAHVLACSSNCSGLRRMADGRRHDPRRLGVGTAVAFDNNCGRRNAVIPPAALAA